MTKKQITDDNSFRDYLNAICLNSLFEHARGLMFPDLIIQIILKHEYMYADCFKSDSIDKSIAAKDYNKELLETSLESIPEEELVELMCELFSKRLMINTIIECTDKYAREDIIYNQNFWRENRICGIDLN
jgi:hypothetical protein